MLIKLRGGRRAAQAGILSGCLALCVTACAQLPVNGPVVKTVPQAATQNTLSQRAAEPVKDATPVQLVRGFLQACAAGTFDDFTVAKKFLVPGAGKGWNPETKIGVLKQEDGLKLEVQGTAEIPVVTGTGDLLMRIDQFGVAEVTSEAVTARFKLEKVFGQWRIAHPPAEIYLPKGDFNNIYAKWPVYFLGADGHNLVSDPRWVARAHILQDLSRDLLAGPSPSLSGTVQTMLHLANPPRKLVKQEGHLVTVSLPSLSLRLSPEQIEQLYRQFQQTLIGLDTVNTVQLVADRVKFDGPTPNVGNGQKPAQNTLLGMSNGQVVEQNGTFTKVIVDAKSLGSGHISWAVTGSGTDSPLVGNQDNDRLMLLRRGRSPQELYRDSQLRIPVVDSRGWIWTGSSTNSQVKVLDLEGNLVTLETPWTEADQLQFLTLNAQGARALAILSGPNGYRAEMLAVERTSEGQPNKLVQPQLVWQGQSIVKSAVWLDDNTAAFLTTEKPDQVVLVPVNSYVEQYSAPAGAVQLVGDTPNGVVQVVNGKTERFNRVGNSWRNVATGLEFVSYSR